MKDYQKISDEVKTLIASSLGIPTETVFDESFLSDLSEDSIQLFELLLAFEQAYGIETTYQDVVHMHTVKDVIQYVKHIKYSV